MTKMTLFAILGFSLLLAWLIVRNSLVEKKLGTIVRIKVYWYGFERIGSLTILIFILLRFFLDRLRTLTNSGMPPPETPPPGIPPEVTFIGYVLFPIILWMLWVSFRFSQLEIDRGSQEIIYSKGVFFPFSRLNIQLWELKKIVVSYSTTKLTRNGSRNYLHIETGSDGKKVKICHSSRVKDIETAAKCLQEHLGLDVVRIHGSDILPPFKS